MLSVDRDGRIFGPGPVPGDGDIAGDGPALATIELAGGCWRPLDCAADGAMLALYLPLCAASVARPLLVAHLGQSLDGHIATASGDSNYVTGAGNLDHLHRMRALCDAIVVGAGTVAADDPQLTTRRVPGPSPVRVVIDPDGRLPASHGLFRDGGAGTLIVRAAAPAALESGAPAGRAAGPGPAAADRVETLLIPRGDNGLDLVAMLAALRGRGLGSIFVEGGGRTISGLLAAGLVDRLQITVAPLVTGRGRRGLDLPPQQSLADALRPASRRFAMGQDVLFDCDLRADPADVPPVTLPRLIS